MAPALEYVAVYFALLLGFTGLSTTTAYCPPLKDVPYGHWSRNSNSPFEYGAKVSLICYFGHKVNKAKSPYALTLEIECETDGKWSEDDLECEPVQRPGCLPLGEPADTGSHYYLDTTATNHISPYEYGAKALLVCPNNYKVNKAADDAPQPGVLEIVCTLEGKWSKDDLACKRLDKTKLGCQPLPPQWDGYWKFDSSFTSPFEHKAKAELVCLHGYKVNKSEDDATTFEIVCLENGKWSEEGLACEPLPGPCEPLKQLPNSHWELSPSFFKYKAKAKLKCLPGFKLPLSDATTFEIECKANGRWSEEDIACEPMS